ncbi:MAG TPA: hypothetical protein VK901_09350 [Nitrospiraceae bacterium]|nr:hypothetical protein [Nitrospiraceae bacterium]
MMPQTESKLFEFLCPGCQHKAPTFSGNSYRWHCPHREVRVIEQGERRRVEFYARDNHSKTWPDFNNQGRYFRRDTI